jgi:Fur family ferric uptake transcriptional regulator/Fur family peroxide stress response transcriptional regulator
LEDYINLLKSNNLKATVQRTAILKSIHKAGHISVEDIYEDIKHQYPTISLATIYKNIIVMLEHNVILEVPINGKKSKYELKKDDHIHTICKVCGRIKDIKITQEKRELLEVRNFNLKYAQINLYGICKKCQLG